VTHDSLREEARLRGHGPWITRGAAHCVMKPTVAEYLRQKQTVRGWLQDIDARVMLNQ
jgi:hypothetical protein